MKPKRPHPDGLQPYRSRTGWRWRVWSKGKVIANGGQGYSRAIDMMSAIESTAGFLHGTTMSISDGTFIATYSGPKHKP